MHNLIQQPCCITLWSIFVHGARAHDGALGFDTYNTIYVDTYITTYNGASKTWILAYINVYKCINVDM